MVPQVLSPAPRAGLLVCLGHECPGEKGEGFKASALQCAFVFCSFENIGLATLTPF